jgi:cell division protein ZapA
MTESESSSTTEVQIFGATYRIRGGQDGGNLADLAAQVDRRMRELSGHAVTADSGKLAILVALNLADELSRREQDAMGERSEIETRVTELTERLAEVLKG